MQAEEGGGIRKCILNFFLLVFFPLSSVLLSFGNPTYIFQISVEALMLSQVFK